MRKDLGNKMLFMPLPVLMLATYDQDGKANVMNAAWGGVYDYNQVYVSPSKHVDAPIIEEYPLTLECTVESFEDGNLIGNVVNVSIDEDYSDENGKIDVDKMEIITFDMINNTYRVLGENVGKAFKDGFDL